MTTKTYWYENVTQGTFHQVAVGSALEERILTDIRDDADPVDVIAFRRGNKAAAPKVLEYRRLSRAEVDALLADSRRKPSTRRSGRPAGPLSSERAN